MADLSPMNNLHATGIAVGGAAVLLQGPSGAGKSDLALRMIHAGAALISDDQVCLDDQDGVLWAVAPAQASGLIEVRHVGILRLPFLARAPLRLCVDLVTPGEALDRLPEPETILLLDHPVPRVKLVSFEASTPVKIHALLTGSWEAV